MFQDMCALIVVRNAVLESSTTCPGTEIVDCDVDNWVDQKCTVECDDACPAVPDSTEVYACGGWQNIYRKIVVDPPDECGLRCPALQRTKKCNQKKCAVDCVMSEWSGYSKCTAECEGGVKTHTRSLLVKPLNGGISCNTNSESEACNSMSWIGIALWSTGPLGHLAQSRAALDFKQKSSTSSSPLVDSGSAQRRLAHSVSQNRNAMCKHAMVMKSVWPSRICSLPLMEVVRSKMEVSTNSEVLPLTCCRGTVVSIMEHRP